MPVLSNPEKMCCNMSSPKRDLPEQLATLFPHRQPMPDLLMVVTRALSSAWATQLTALNAMNFNKFDRKREKLQTLVTENGMERWFVMATAQRRVRRRGRLSFVW